MRAERFNRSIIESSIDMIMAFDAEGISFSSIMQHQWNSG